MLSIRAARAAVQRRTVAAMLAQNRALVAEEIADAILRAQAQRTDGPGTDWILGAREERAREEQARADAATALRIGYAAAGQEPAWSPAEPSAVLAGDRR